MSTWECGVCGYLHKEDEPPELCPICEAPAQMFKENVEEEQDASEVQGVEKTEDVGQVEATENVEQEPVVAEPAVIKKWRCSICGYVHTGVEPPEKCPICDAPKRMFVEIDEDGKALTEVKEEEVADDGVPAKEKGQKKSTSFLDKLANLSMKLHLHPIMVHFPNGILPAVVIFLGIAVYFKIELLESVAHYNLIFVLIMLPMVMLTGFIEWQKRYKGIKTFLFIVKIICSLIVLGAVNVLVFWRLIDPAVMAEGSPSRLIYLGIAGGMLAAAGLAGHLGGKLVFGPRD